MGLTSVPVGRYAVVVALTDASAAGDLAALGVLPGVTLVLVQRYPAFVFRTGHTELAVDAELADAIQVRLVP